MRQLLLSTILVLCCSYAWAIDPDFVGVMTSAAGNSQAAYNDNFNRTDENPIAAPWTTLSSDSVRIYSNAVMSTGFSEAIAYHNGVLNNNQYATVKILRTDLNGSGVGVRMDSSRSNQAKYGYVLWVADGNLLVLRKWTDGSFSNLATWSYAPAINDVLRLEVAGNVLKGYINGVERVSATDSTYASGYAGVQVRNAYDVVIDDFTSGDL